MSIGKDITASDNDKAFLAANDEIRGVETVCYGDCPSGICTEDTVNIHDITWKAPYDCVNGGVIRSKITYTNLQTSGFKTPIGYSGHFYGIRKYDGLIPYAPYDIVVQGQTGSNLSIKVPTELNEIEYGINDYVGYSGVKFSAPYQYRSSGDKYGKSIAVKNNTLAIGAPMTTVPYTEYDSSGNLVTYNLDKTGIVYLYKREDRPSGNWPIDKDSSPWILHSNVLLPSSILKDYYTERTIYDLPLPVKERVWEIGQEGREFGHSISLSSNNRLVVGAPSAAWNYRSFEELQTSGVQIGLMIFVDEFEPKYSLKDEEGNILTDSDNKPIVEDESKIRDGIKNLDLIFQYFSNPPVKFDVKIIICQPLGDYSNKIVLDFPEPKPEYIVKSTIGRNQGLVNEDRTEKILSDIKNAFYNAFPYDNTKLNNNIPPLLGVYVDETASLGRESLSPAIDRFFNHYKEYSFASGLVDFYNTRSSGEIVEIISPPPYGDTRLSAENWVSLSLACLYEMLDTGRLVQNNRVRFFTSGVGEDAFNNNLSRFNYPPTSGGKVFIFEEENGSWNLIQQISADSSTITTDRFGHSVSISDNGEIVVIGSPYTNETCKAFEYDPSEKQRLLSQISSWLRYKSSITGGNNFRYTTLLNNYQQWLNNNGFQYANKSLYDSLTQDEKFEARNYFNIKEYKNIFKYNGVIGTLNYGNDYTWPPILNRYVASPRLGYSTAVNETGDIIAFGAPTDGLNKYDDMRIYYKNLGYSNKLSPELDTNLIPPSWASTVNAGAVRVFESRKYYPHNRVIEYGKFGNLHRSLSDPLDSGHFNYLATIFNNRDFITTPFAETDIPQDAGLVFIITPEIDAASDEIIDKIYNWLALGDRNLVLVGNDPIWESDGAYTKSNDIINKILNKLDSRMKLYPARNYIEACVKDCSTNKAIASYRPEGGTPTYIQPLDMNIYGVADIRTNFDNIDQWKNLNIFSPCYTEEQKSNLILALSSLPNTKCELPIRNTGDLRSEWKYVCGTCDGKIVKYSFNYPYLFKNFKSPCCEDNDDNDDLRLDTQQNKEPVPILAAALLDYETITIPSSPAVSGFKEIYTPQLIEKSIAFIDTEVSVSGYSFILDASGNNASYINYNEFKTISSGLFYAPPVIEERNSLLQANAIPAQEIINRFIVSNITVNLSAQDNYNSTSKIITIGSLDLETEESLYIADDNNLNFYVNLVSKPNQRGGSRIAQLGGWTGRTSFTSAKTNSILQELFNNTNNAVRLDATNLSILDDICWIANPQALPSKDEIQEIKNWLNFPNRKLIITYDNTQTQVRLIKKLLEMLNSKLKPLYSPSTENYREITTDPFTRFIPVNPLHFASYGPLPKYNITNFRLSSRLTFIPMENSENVIPIMSLPIQDINTVYDTVGYWGTNTGYAKISFPAIPGSGYKIFISSISESPNENVPIDLYISNVNTIFDLPYPPPPNRFPHPVLTKIGVSDTISNTTNPNIINTNSYNVQVLENSSNIDIYFNSEIIRLPNVTNSYLPKTTRIIGISGILLPVIKSKEFTIRQVLSGYEPYEKIPFQPEEKITTQRWVPFSNLNDQYCSSEDCLENDFGNQYIYDGPIVAAQEEEHITSFQAGVNRSRITLLSDSSLVQGRCFGDDNFRASPNAVAFIQSLYPNTNFSSLNFGRQYNITEKIIAPDRGSPQKYYSVINNSGLNKLFSGTNNALPQKSISAFTSNDSNYDPAFVLNPPPVYLDSDDFDTRKLKSQEALNKFEAQQWQFGGSTKFSGIIDGKLYIDAGIEGGMPQIMKDTGYDYLDFERFPSGYPGDLFGYSIGLSKNKLIVGAPFAGFSQEDPQNWSYFVANGSNAINSGISLGYNGGAGSVYVYERNFNGSGLHGTKSAWQMTQKIRPSNINIGQDLIDSGSAVSIIGSHPYSNQELTDNSIIGDKFGSSVDISSDVIVVGAPGHDFDNLYINSTGEFIRKSFNSEFTIPDRLVFDLGLSGYRSQFINSGSVILNNGAIYVFENGIVDWATKKQKWTLVEKIIPQGSGSRLYGSENDQFGSIARVHRSFRSDADYTIIGGTSSHILDSGGLNPKINAGATYVYDAMLREQPPSIPSPSSYIDARIFGEKDNNRNPEVRIIVQNSGQNKTNYYNSGIIYADSKGQIFIEASGQDPINKGFIVHRPYIVSIDGKYAFGIPDSGQLGLFITAKGGDLSGNMSLFNRTEDEAIVYNNVGLYNGAIIDFATNFPSGLSLYIDCPDPISISESGLCLYTASGIGTNTDALNLRIRGK